jgi:hypothetical protein
VGPPPYLRSSLVGERIACDGVQPGKWFVRHAVELPPTDEKSFGNDVLDRLG